MKKWLAYGAYVSAITIGFLYLLFPGDAVISYIKYRFDTAVPGFDLSIRDVKPAFPPGLTFYAPSLEQSGQTLIAAQSVSIEPSYLTLLSPDKIFYINGRGCGGHLEGAVTLKHEQNPPGMDLELVFRDLLLADIPEIKQLFPHELSGRAEGRIVFGNSKNPLGEGTAEILISDSRIKLKAPMMGIKEIAFKTIKSELEMASQRILIKKLEVEGPDVTGEATGSILLTHPVDHSIINIAGRINPQARLIKGLSSRFPMELVSKNMRGGGMPFRISGTITHPNFSLR